MARPAEQVMTTIENIAFYHRCQKEGTHHGMGRGWHLRGTEVGQEGKCGLEPLLWLLQEAKGKLGNSGQDWLV